MRAEDLILMSVDDHIAEPADMFDAHVPARYKDLAPRVVEEESGAEHGATAGSGTETSSFEHGD